jgi:hypothetical protein
MVPRSRQLVLLGASLLAPLWLLHGCGGQSSSAAAASSGATGAAGTTGTAGTTGSTSTGAGGGSCADCTDGGPSDSGTGPSFTCFATGAPLAPSPCPPIAGAGKVSFCYRAQFAGITTVDVFGTFGQANDWTAPFLTLTNDGTGTFTGSAAIADGSYPYMFRVQGGADGYVLKNQYLLDQNNASFVNTPPGSPNYSATSTVPRACSVVTVPQVAAGTSYKLQGQVVYGGKPQSCYTVKLEVGELVVGNVAKREHNTANITETGADGSFEFDVAGGLTDVSVTFPFGLVETDGGYPDPQTYRSAAFASPAMLTVAADTTIDPVDVAYRDYDLMMPVGEAGTLPVTFTYTVIAGAYTAGFAADKTNIAGNDPGFLSPLSAMTTYTWDGAFGGSTGMAMPGTVYYWGTFQKQGLASDAGSAWTVESMLLPITFQ